jgi:hypothetical protein
MKDSRMTPLQIDLADEDFVDDYIDGTIAMKRLEDPTDPVISSEEFWRSRDEDS